MGTSRRGADRGWCTFPGCDVAADVVVAGAPMCALHRTLLVEAAPPSIGSELRAGDAAAAPGEAVAAEAGDTDPPVADQVR